MSHFNLGLGATIGRQHEVRKLFFIGIRQEGEAAIASSPYRKLTGQPTACWTIAGSGATNLVPGLCDEKLDRITVLAARNWPRWKKLLGPGRHDTRRFDRFTCAKSKPRRAMGVVGMAGYLMAYEMGLLRMDIDLALPGGSDPLGPFCGSVITSFNDRANTQVHVLLHLVDCSRMIQEKGIAKSIR